jgi:peptide/nickel transport system ATP-binding protein
MQADATPLLELRGLSVGFRSGGSDVPVVEDVSFDIGRGEIVGLVGESGCGKSVTAMSILGLLPALTARVIAGKVLFDKQDLLAIGDKRLRELRGRRIGVIFQEPMTSLNPTYSVGYQLTEVLKIHRIGDRDERRQAAVEMLRLVGITAPERRLRQYPHELSGGIRQRVMIAMALICEPDLVIADEPTTALDVTIQAQILELLGNLNDRIGAGILMITHDLGVVAEFCQRVVVMYAGRVVEEADVETLFATPRHPYTQGLLASIPRLDSVRGRLSTIPGAVPAPGRRGGGCYFAGRCARAGEQCSAQTPILTPAETTRHTVACWNPFP